MTPENDYPGILSFLRRGAERLETSDVKVFERYRKPRVRDLIPLQGDIQKDDTDWKINVGEGFVIPRHNASGDTGAPITITDLPIEGAELTVVATDKCYVKLNISVLGKVTTAVFEKASTWPTDTPPILAGGDLAGTVGTRHIRILEVVEETTGFLVIEQIHTGHIDHFQPELCDNTSNSVSGNEARVLKEWDATAGVWKMRYLVAGDGVEITENADTITVAATTSFSGGADMNLSLNQLNTYLGASDELIFEDELLPLKTLYFRNGLFIGEVDPEDSPAGLITADATYVVVSASPP